MLVDVDRLDRLVDDLLALARLDESAGRAARREPVDARRLCRGRGRRLRRRAGAGDVARLAPVTVVRRPRRAAPRRRQPRRQRRALRPHRRVACDVEPSTRAGRPAVRLTVADDGPGIPETERERVFDRFYRVQESRSRETGGTGLGLPIVRDIVRAHGGRVRLTARADGAARPAARRRAARHSRRLTRPRLTG